MYAPGHWGVALLCYAPLGVAAATAGYEPLAILGLLACVALSTLPDCDEYLPGVKHRGPTHTLGFAAVVGLALGGVIALATSFPTVSIAGPAVPFFVAVGTLSIGSHLLADVITPMGIRPFRPLSDRHYTLEVTKAKNPRANRLLLLAGLTATAGVAAVALFVG